MFYTYLGKNGTKNRYEITLKLFVRCDATNDQFDTEVNISVYKGNGDLVRVLGGIKRAKVETYNATDVDPCIVNPPQICYKIGYYTTTTELEPDNSGYVVTFQRCCRRTGLTNIFSDNNDVGATYYARIPDAGSGFTTNTGPRFSKEKGVIVCANSRFTMDYSAEDADKDSLAYSFSTAFSGGSPNNPAPDPSLAPPYYSVSYKSPFDASQPLGDKVTIDPKTGIISGIAPRSGLYIVTVTAKEYRGGVLIGEHRKEFQFTVQSCVRQVVAATLDKYADCDDFTINFVNTSTPNKRYHWDFGDGTSLDTTTQNIISHRYADTGTYIAKLVVDRESSCGDSITSIVRVYPGLIPAFSLSGLCTARPSMFNNASRTEFGAIDIYRWDFGDVSTLADTSDQRDATYQYTVPGDYDVSLYVHTTKGCERKISNTFRIYDNPPLVATQDTLLCYLNDLQLRAESTVPGSYSWQPLYNITNPLTATPVVAPRRDTTYEVTFTDGTGCVNTKKVFVDVRHTLNVHAGTDSTICTGDPVELRAVADGAYEFAWMDLQSRLIVGTAPHVTVTPPQPNGSFQVQVKLGDCEARDTISFTSIDPPAAYAGEDTTICYGERASLYASGGAYYVWAPLNTLTSPRLPETYAWPKDTTLYTVTVTDTLGCPKPVQSSVMVNVVPPVPAFAGNDTIITLGQPFQLHASGGATYRWSPADGLNRTDIADPVTGINRDFTYQVQVFTPEGCKGEDDIFVRFIAGPEIYVPNAFTPNGDGINDVFRPLPVGITRLDRFQVFNRWGEEIFITSKYLRGWDGNFGGRKAEAGTYVWVVQGLNTDGKLVEKRGTVTLIR